MQKLNKLLVLTLLVVLATMVSAPLFAGQAAARDTESVADRWTTPDFYPITEGRFQRFHMSTYSCLQAFGCWTCIKTPIAGHTDEWWCKPKREAYDAGCDCEPNADVSGCEDRGMCTYDPNGRLGY